MIVLPLLLLQYSVVNGIINTMARLENYSFATLDAAVQDSGQGFVFLENSHGDVFFDWVEVRTAEESENYARYTGRAALSQAKITLKHSRAHDNGFATLIYADLEASPSLRASAEPKF